MKIFISVFTNTDSADSATIVSNRVSKAIGTDKRAFEIEEYSKGGHKCTLVLDVEITPWEHVVYSTIEMAQAVGRNFSVTGSIGDDLDLWSNDSSISGVDSIHLSCNKNDN